MHNQTACTNMVKQQLRTSGVLNESILALYDDIPRAAFVPQAQACVAYSDLQIPLAHGQCMMTPVEEATLLQALALKGHERVLEVGTGSGFLTALLSRLCQHLISIDYYADFTDHARRLLQQHACDNVELLTGNAAHGWVDSAPYDVIIFTGAVPVITETHRLQVLPHGQLFAVVGEAPIMQGQLHALSSQDTWSQTVLFETLLPPLLGSTPSTTFVF